MAIDITLIETILAVTTVIFIIITLFFKLKIEKHKEIIQSMKNQIEKIDIKDKEISSLESQRDKIDKEIEKLKKIKKKSEGQNIEISSLESQRDKIDREIEKLKKFKKRSEDQNKEINFLRSQLDQKDDEIKRLKDFEEKRKDQDKEINFLRSQLDQKDDEIKKLNQKIIDFKQDLENIEEEKATIVSREDDSGIILRKGYSWKGNWGLNWQNYACCYFREYFDYNLPGTCK